VDESRKQADRRAEERESETDAKKKCFCAPDER
jgi:hypothetical protein